MRPVSDQILVCVPALLAVGLIALFTAPMQAAGIAFVPNVAWVMTLIVALLYPPAWPIWFGFALGLVQDVVFATPLGAQALLTLLLVQLVRMHGARYPVQPFRMRWLEASGVLVVWHGLLWALYHFVTSDAPPLRNMLYAGLVSALWYPLFYAALTRLIGLFPAAASPHVR